MPKYAFFPGCVSRGGCPELYPAAKLVCQKLGIELEEMTGASCTGAGVLQEKNEFLGDVLNARTFAMAEQMELAHNGDLLHLPGRHEPGQQETQGRPGVSGKGQRRTGSGRPGIQGHGATQAPALGHARRHWTGRHQAACHQPSPSPEGGPILRLLHIRPSDALGFR